MNVLINGLLTFEKNLALELWFQNFKTTQNTRFSQLQNLTNELRYEVKVLYVIRHP